MPGLAVDACADVVVIHADSAATLRDWLPDLESVLADRWSTAYVKVHVRGVNRASQVQRAPAWGEARDEVVVLEHGVRYLVRPATGLSVGLFLDMREVRQWLRTASPDLSVLNLFAYTCSLGASAALGGARRVLNLDLSRPYLEWGKANYNANDLSVDDRDFVYGDVFDWLSRFQRRREQFDLVIVDPPSFSSTPFSVAHDYESLVSLTTSVVSPGGTLLAATNHVATGRRQFEMWLTSGAARAGRQSRMARSWHEPSVDFPVASGQRPYLKVAALQLLD
jgi:23S rRNA (cytosine1962-C5)-methyltransferase